MWILGTLVKHSIPILQSYQLSSRKGARTSGFFSARKHCPKALYDDSDEQIRAFALRKSEKKLVNVGKSSNPGTLRHINFPSKGLEDSQVNSREENEGSCNTFDEPRDNLSSYSLPANPARDAVLKACTITSGALLALGFVIREASHIASVEGWPILDASTEVSFNHLLNFSWLRDAARPTNIWNSGIDIILPLCST